MGRCSWKTARVAGTNLATSAAARGSGASRMAGTSSRGCLTPCHSVKTQTAPAIPIPHARHRARIRSSYTRHRVRDTRRHRGGFMSPSRSSCGAEFGYYSSPWKTWRRSAGAATILSRHRSCGSGRRARTRWVGPGRGPRRDDSRTRPAPCSTVLRTSGCRWAAASSRAIGRRGSESSLPYAACRSTIIAGAASSALPGAVAFALFGATTARHRPIESAIPPCAVPDPPGDA